MRQHSGCWNEIYKQITIWVNPEKDDTTNKMLLVKGGIDANTTRWNLQDLYGDMYIADKRPLSSDKCSFACVKEIGRELKSDQSQSDMAPFGE